MQVTEHAKYRGIGGSQRNTNYQRTSFSAASPSAARRSLRRCLGQQREPAERNSVDLHNPTCKGNNILLVMCTGTAGSYGLQRYKRLQTHRGLSSAHQRELPIAIVATSRPGAGRAGAAALPLTACVFTIIPLSTITKFLAHHPAYAQKRGASLLYVISLNRTALVRHSPGKPAKVMIIAPHTAVVNNSS